MKTIRQYQLNNYLLCPRLFKLCQEFEPKQAEAMIKGKIFESLLFGFKNPEEEKELCMTKAGKPKSCIAPIKELADKLRHLFIRGRNHNRLFIRINEEYEISLEPDYVGEFLIEHTGETVNAIVDLKFTGDINKIWDYKTTKDDYFQACSYTWGVWNKTGEILPFYYLVVEDNDYETPIYRLIEVIITPADLQWFRSLVNTALSDIFLEPNVNHCLGAGKFDPRCRLLQYCDFGRNKVGGSERLLFSDLPCNFQPEQEVKDETDWSELGKKKQTVYDESVLNPDIEIEETDLENIETLGFKNITVCADDKREDGYICRNCRTIAIKENDKKCSNCGVELIWI